VSSYGNLVRIIGRKIAATKLGAKNQLACPNGYNKNTETNTAIGPENA
jgi:hypothetical protein